MYTNECDAHEVREPPPSNARCVLGGRTQLLVEFADSMKVTCVPAFELLNRRLDPLF